jgi:GT2 family glycosyltransferase
MTHPKVTVGVVLYLGEKYLNQSLPSLLNQNYPNIEYLLRDQSPNGEAYQFLQKNLPEILTKAKLEQGENLGHSGGHNILMRKMTGEYYLCASYDMLYPPNLVSTLVAEMEKAENQKYGSATCKLLRWNFQENSTDPEISKSNFLDSTGICLTKGHHFFEIGQGEKDQGQYDHFKDIFGASGALSFFRKQALADIAYTNKKGLQEYFDELFHYKNDVDLAYRLQWAGWPCLLISQAKVYHDRQVASKLANRPQIINILHSRNKANWAKESSFLGHLMVLQKNFSHQPFSFSVRFQTTCLNFLRLLYINVFERYLLKQLKVIQTNQAEIKDKAAKIPRKVKPATIEKLMA